MEDINKLQENELCPVCNSNHRLFVEKDDNGNDSRMCFSCGYMTTSQYKMGSDMIVELEQKQPKLITALKIEDNKLNCNWYPTVIQIPNKGMIFPEGNSIDNWVWTVAKIISIPVFERINYPKPNTDGEFYDTKLDIDNAKRFGKLNFLDACKELGIVINTEKVNGNS